MSDTTPPRKVTWLLGTGIVFVPYIFSWFTLKQGYSKNAKIASFIWMSVALLLIGSNNQKNHQEVKLQQHNKAKTNEARRQNDLYAGGKELYTYFKIDPGNADSKNYNEQEYIGGQLISVCNINGRPRGHYGWIEFRTVFIQGQRIKNAPIERLYVFFITDGKPGDEVSGMWRGENYRQAVIDDMKRTCD